MVLDHCLSPVTAPGGMVAAGCCHKMPGKGRYWNRVNRTPAPIRGLALLSPTEV